MIIEIIMDRKLTDLTDDQFTSIRDDVDELIVDAEDLKFRGSSTRPNQVKWQIEHESVFNLIAMLDEALPEILDPDHFWMNKIDGVGTATVMLQVVD